ncbi:hypothetical protein GN956_G22467 [Arapaima gigas]
MQPPWSDSAKQNVEVQTGSLQADDVPADIPGSHWEVERPARPISPGRPDEEGRAVEGFCRAAPSAALNLL